MVKIKIGGSEKNLEDADNQWVRDQVNRRRINQDCPWVFIHIEKRGVCMSLCTPNYPHSAGGSRRPNREEQEIFNLWERRNMNREDYDVSRLIQFLGDLYSYIG